MPTLERGSAKLLRRRWASPMPDDAIETILKAIDFEETRVNDVFCHGMPDPEFITGSVTVQRESFDRVANNLLNIEACRLLDLKAFPRGIPVIDEIMVDFRVGR